MPIRKYSFEGRLDTVTIAAGGQNSGIFVIPNHASNVTFFIPTLEAATTLALQKMVPRRDLEGGTETWYNVWSFDVAAGAQQQIDGLGDGASDRAIVLPCWLIGIGVCRLVASGAQTAQKVIEIEIGQE